MPPIRFPQLHDAHWLGAQRRSGRTIPQIAAGLGCSTSLVASMLRRHGITVQSTLDGPAERVTLHAPAQLVEWFGLRASRERRSRSEVMREALSEYAEGRTP